MKERIEHISLSNLFLHSFQFQGHRLERNVEMKSTFDMKLKRCQDDLDSETMKKIESESRSIIERLLRKMREYKKETSFDFIFY